MFKSMLLQISLILASLSLCAEIVISPTRIIFDKDNTQEQISITNNGNDTLYFSISFIQYAMTEQGSLQLLTNSDNNDFAHPYIRIYPRRLQLSPYETKSIRLQFTPVASLEEKEYRSHLFFEALNTKNVFDLAEQHEKESLQIAITPLYNFSIPVFIRNTKAKPVCEIKHFDLTKENDGRYISFIVHRKGLTSTYGNIYVDFFKTDGTVHTVAQTLGVAIYTNIDRRYFKLPVNNIDVNNLNGTFRVKYVMDDHEEELYVKNEFIIGQEE